MAENMTPLIEGKTKVLYPIAGRDGFAHVTSKDDITAGDGKKHDKIEGKGALSNQTTCNVFLLLKACGIPVAFEERAGPTTFVAPLCTMLPYEVVVRRAAYGSHLKRNPHLTKGHVFPHLLVEFYLKTSEEVAGTHEQEGLRASLR
ncbi:hypothetical protein COU19_00130 [Candidatus Kaiserbacteria bacterium CG10_big_fil_rev_8_21_14_0_10_56_12]|uniref:phosphoribosylaminoimidazolesuccinocarboxamide synthase n=1 Tax=Candidatus Kaiserbacteria bacterium CG10_big_fil_rev_8_21_14_0_10_56_12 TaxID=1974611 RepID=A0A2H0UCU4_9BACT|nr:MAG: hypothetical protein COU19_00130 [Candidatus Kaiserbacteria bacterium CG10_big_fil_rev_8_21_14_0_10_56_12]